jgi:hypothetical protein
MPRFNNPLDHVRVAAPCTVDWDLMIGSERMRFCGQCSLNVYNLSGMTRSEAEHLIARNEGRLCVRFYRRDGSIITKDCPVGLRAIRRRVSSVTRAIGSMVLGLFAGFGVHGAFSNIASLAKERTMGVLAKPMEQPVEIQGAIPPPGLMMGPPVMGKAVRVDSIRKHPGSDRRQGNSQLKDR